MTYCLALCLDAGIVFAGDTRTNAGVDYVTNYRKVHVFRPTDDRVFVMLAAGSLATTHELLDGIERDLTLGGESLATVRDLSEAADYVGRKSRAIQDKHLPALAASGVSGEVSLLLGGQVAGTGADLVLIYPQGNYIGASEETPFLQIGEAKYGKPVLDRLAHRGLSLDQGASLALVSLDATVRSNITVGLPFDLACYARDSLAWPQQTRIEADSPYYVGVRQAWQQGFESMFAALPPFETTPTQG